MCCSSFLTYFAALAATATPMENASLIAPPATGTTTMAVDTGPGSTEPPLLMLGDARQEEEDTTAVDSWSDRPDTATLTKGFSIPTYLPPFPDFIPADLPHLQRNASSRAAHPADSSSSNISNISSPSGSPVPPNEQSRLHAYDSEQKAQQLRREKELAKERELLPRRQLSLPPLNATVQAGQHAYLPCKVSGCGVMGLMG